MKVPHKAFIAVQILAALASGAALATPAGEHRSMPALEAIFLLMAFAIVMLGMAKRKKKKLGFKKPTS